MMYTGCKAVSVGGRKKMSFHIMSLSYQQNVLHVVECTYSADQTTCQYNYFLLCSVLNSLSNTFRRLK